MAYASLIGQVVTTKAELYARIRDFVCKRNGDYDYSTTGIGWTLYDEVLSDTTKTGVKSVVFDIANTHTSTLFLGIRSIEFSNNGTVIPLTATDFTAYSTTNQGTGYEADKTFDTTTSKTGDWITNQWLSATSAATNQRLIIVFNSTQTFDKIVVNNSMASGGQLTTGAKTVKVTTSTDSITSTVYNEAISNSSVIYDGDFLQHIAADSADDQDYDLIATQALNDYFVVYSAGSSTNEDMYYLFKWISGAFQVHGYLSWNNTTHTGVTPFGSTSTMTSPEALTSLTLDIHGDMDSFFTALQNGSETNVYGNYNGKVDTIYDDTVGTCSTSLSSGSDISIVVDAVPSRWAVGLPIFIRDKADIRKVTIKTLDGPSKTITADLPVGFTSPVKLSLDVGYICSGSNQFAVLGKALIDHAGAKPASNLTYYAPTFGSTNDPEDLRSERFSWEYFVAGTNTVWGTLRNVRYTNLTGLTHRDLFTDENGDDWRWFKIYSSKYVLVKEV